MLDVVIVGGGPAGLSAALILGRCRRRALVCDSGEPRNAASHALHGFLSRDGTDPMELRRLGRAQLSAYPSVAYQAKRVEDVRPLGDEGFAVVLSDGEEVRTRFLLLATGVVDELPSIDGLAPCWGKSVFHCPYCDGWEQQDRALAVYGRGDGGVAYALELRVWSDDVALLTHGDRSLTQPQRARLSRHGVKLFEEPIARLEAREGTLARVVFEGGSHLGRQALFLRPEQFQRSQLAEKLGCSLRDNLVQTGKYQVAGRSRLFVAGDAVRSVQLAIVAAAEGAQAAFAINEALIEEDFR